MSTSISCHLGVRYVTTLRILRKALMRCSVIGSVFGFDLVCVLSKREPLGHGTPWDMVPRSPLPFLLGLPCTSGHRKTSVLQILLYKGIEKDQDIAVMKSSPGPLWMAFATCFFRGGDLTSTSVEFSGGENMEEVPAKHECKVAIKFRYIKKN